MFLGSRDPICRGKEGGLGISELEVVTLSALVGESVLPQICSAPLQRLHPSHHSRGNPHVKYAAVQYKEIG